MQPGAIYGEAWDLYKRFWKHFLPIALIIFLIVSGASLVLVLLLGWLGAILGFLLSLAGTFWLQGAIATAVADVRDGRVDFSVSETLKRVGPFVARLAGAGLLAALGIIGGLILLIVPGLILLTWWVLITPRDRAREPRAQSRRSAAAASSCAGTAGTSSGQSRSASASGSPPRSSSPSHWSGCPTTSSNSSAA